MEIKDNYTKFPNAMFDEFKSMNKGEILILLAVWRQTVGYQKPAAPISRSLFIILTGLDKNTVEKSLKKLMHDKFIIKVGKGRTAIPEWHLGERLSLKNQDSKGQGELELSLKNRDNLDRENRDNYPEKIGNKKDNINKKENNNKNGETIFSPEEYLSNLLSIIKTQVKTLGDFREGQEACFNYMNYEIKKQKMEWRGHFMIWRKRLKEMRNICMNETNNDIVQAYEIWKFKFKIFTRKYREDSFLQKRGFNPAEMYRIYNELFNGEPEKPKKQKKSVDKSKLENLLNDMGVANE